MPSDEARILVIVSGGLVQEIYTTDSAKAKVVLIDWDNIKEGDVGSEPWVEYDATPIAYGRFDEMLNEAEHEHAERRVCRHCGVPLIKGFKVVHDESNCSEFLWRRDEIQFPRLLAGISAVGLTEAQKHLLAKSMAVDPERIDELFDRARQDFERWKKEIAPDASGTAD